ncbi:MAG: isochorismatase family protein, partial [Xanthobacteraceae bacterium]
MTRFSRRQVVGSLGAGLAAALLAPARVGLAAGGIAVDDKSVLIVVDVQNCFLPGGSLAVKDGEQVVPIINRIASKFAHVVMTQDWHTPGHISFASSHPGKTPFEMIKLSYGDQVLWPDHCVQGTPGADISK